MTANDELRKMLDERGVEYDTRDSKDIKKTMESTYWDDPDGRRWGYTSDESGAIKDRQLFLLRGRMDFTPAQAIAATLGVGTCKLKEIDKGYDTASEYMLNREWCFDAVYRCSCGCRFGHAAHDRPRFCPNCGARIVEADE